MLVTIEFYRIEFCSKEKGCETSATIEPGTEKYKLRGLEPYTEYQVGSLLLSYSSNLDLYKACVI